MPPTRDQARSLAFNSGERAAITMIAPLITEKISYVLQCMLPSFCSVTGASQTPAWRLRARNVDCRTTSDRCLPVSRGCITSDDRADTEYGEGRRDMTQEDLADDACPDPRQIADRQDFASSLTILKEQAGLTVREIARTAGLPTATAGDYFSGRHLPQV